MIIKTQNLIFLAEKSPSILHFLHPFNIRLDCSKMKLKSSNNKFNSNKD